MGSRFGYRSCNSGPVTEIVGSLGQKLCKESITMSAFCFCSPPNNNIELELAHKANESSSIFVISSFSKVDYMYVIQLPIFKLLGSNKY